MANYTLGWLPAVLPAEARRFRVEGSTLSAVLAGAGAELVDASPDVEIVRTAAQLGGDARVAVVSIEPAVGAGLPRLARAASKAAAAGRMRLRVARERRRLRRLGYARVSVVLWDVRHRVELPGLPPLRRSLAERLPSGALLIGTRGEREPTALETALQAAARGAGVELRPAWASIRPGPVLVVSNAGVLRVAIGQGRVEIESQIAALEALSRADVPPLVADRVPRLVAEGRAGLARWSLERALPGARPPPEVTSALVDECVDFLVALHAAGGDDGGSTLLEDAETVAAACGADGARRARALGELLQRELAAVPRGLGHGDFFAGNLLAEGDRLTGVLDWDAGGAGRLPLVDLLHLQLTRAPYGGDDDWGRAVLDRLLEMARAGGDEIVRRYCRAVALPVDRGLLEHLVLAYWLGYAAYQLRTHADRRAQPVWIERNLELVLRDVVPSPTGNARAAVRGAQTREA